MNWLFGVIGVALFYSLAQMYARTCLNSKIDFRVLMAHYLLICGFFGLLLFSYLYAHNAKIEINGNFKTILLTTILFIIGTMFLFYSISRKIELGVMNTVRTALQIMLTILFGYLYFNEQLSKIQLLGAVLGIVGIFLVYKYD